MIVWREKLVATGVHFLVTLLLAACAAALAGCGQGKDEPAPDEAAGAELLPRGSTDIITLDHGVVASLRQFLARGFSCHLPLAPSASCW